MSTREENIKRIVETALKGVSLADLTQMDRNDLWAVANIDLAPYERNNFPANHGVYGEVTLEELRIAQSICKTIPSAT